MKLNKKLPVISDILSKGHKTLLFLLFVGLCQSGIAQRMTATTTAKTTAAEGETIVDPNSFGFIVRISGPSSDEEEFVDYDIRNSATNGDDFETLSGSARFPPGARAVFIPVEVIDDELIENVEQVTIALTDATAPYSFNPNPVTVTITDNDQGVLTLVRSDGAAAETEDDEAPNRGRYVLTLEGQNGTGQPFRVPYSFAGTANSGGGNADFTLSPPGQAGGGICFSGRC